MQLSEIVHATDGLFDSEVACVLRWKKHCTNFHEIADAHTVSNKWSNYVHESRQIRFINTSLYPYALNQALVLLCNPTKDGRFERSQISPEDACMCFVPAGTCLLEFGFNRAFVRLKDASLLDELIACN